MPIAVCSKMKSTVHKVSHVLHRGLRLKLRGFSTSTTIEWDITSYLETIRFSKHVISNVNYNLHIRSVFYLQSSVVGEEEERDRYGKHDGEGKALQAGADLERSRHVEN